MAKTTRPAPPSDQQDPGREIRDGGFANSREIQLARRRRFLVGEPLPQVLMLEDVAELLGVGVTRAWELQRAGDLDRFEMKPRLGNRARYSGKKIQQWLDGEGEASRFFGGARRALGK